MAAHEIARPVGTGWSEEADAVIAGDLATALAYVTPARGVVVTPITTAGVRDRQARTVTFTTSLGFGRKLERIRSVDQVTLAFHAREHGFADGPAFVLVQGHATIGWTDITAQRTALLEGMVRFSGAPKSGRFWNWWMQEYYVQRLPVTIAVERVTTWPDPAGREPPTVHGAPVPVVPPDAQAAPAGGVAPRLSTRRAGRRLQSLPHLLLGWLGADGFPTVAPVTIDAVERDGLTLLDPTGTAPPGGRRAGLVGHSFGPALTALRTQQHTGWLEVGNAGIRYSPHTQNRYRTPRGTTPTSLVNGGKAKRGLRRKRAGTVATQ